MTLPFSARVCSLALSLNDVKTIKDHLGVTINDVVIGIIFLGTQLYFQETQQQQLKNARATTSILFDIRNVEGKLSLDEIIKGNLWGNRILIMELLLLILEDEDLTNPLKFILKAHNIINRKRSGIYSPYLLAGPLEIVRAFGGLQVRPIPRSSLTDVLLGRWSNTTTNPQIQIYNPKNYPRLASGKFRSRTTRRFERTFEL
ncbi:uncharacterized protein LOC110697281 [Chenopodium quinoa]|uniref:uncharacterized protein LOC110697281 n=1 Tax=Chenopodium quinoa TaxID=63459 RepID=UPI000B76FC3C|nr:uncharacterized protein LOC110697281 [Chenopodium quinoa]